MSFNMENDPIYTFFEKIRKGQLDLYLCFAIIIGTFAYIIIAQPYKNRALEKASNPVIEHHKENEKSLPK